MRSIPSALGRSQDTAGVFFKKRKGNSTHGEDAAKETRDAQPVADAVVGTGISTSTSHFIATFTPVSSNTAEVSSSSSGTIAPAQSATGSLGSSPRVFQFTDLNNATTCNDFTFKWNYTGSAIVLMTLFVNDSCEFGYPTNGTFTLTPSPTPSTAISSALRVFTADVPSDEEIYTWRIVDVQEGWYVLHAQETGPINGVSASSTPFFVQNGTSLGCLKTSKGAVVPAMSSRHLATADLIGIILGALAAAVFLTIAFIFPRLWRRALPSPKTKRPYLLY